MVRLALPPPESRRRISPTHHTLPAGSNLFRIHDPAALHGSRDGKTFRWRGPYARFDHHRGTGGRERRGIWYGGLTLSCAVVEAFDIGVVDPGTKRLARARATHDLLLLDLRGRAAMRAGTVAAISARDHSLSQPWSRYFWEHSEIYGELDGLFYLSAHNGQPAVALYERGRDGLEVPRGHDALLTDPAVLAAVRRAALDHGLVLLPPS
jgi:RES domain